MKVVITGSSGMVGTALTEKLRAQGDEVVSYVRKMHPGKTGQYLWNPEAGTIDSAGLSGASAVVNLAGENIAAKRWTPEQKEKIRTSRVEGTTLLSHTIAGLPAKPEVLVSASAIGFYGDRGDEMLTENSAPGSGFLAEVCKEWEQSTKAAEASGVRIVRARLGVVLSKNGGALQKMLPIFQLGGGGIIGSGKQYMSWVTLDDVVNALIFAIKTKSVTGPINIVAPNSVRNSEFTDALGHALHRPAVLPLPAFAAKIIMGEMADELLLSSARVEPLALEGNKFGFEYPNLAGALLHTLGKSA
ncbi:MAG: TIGR01777 family oxidoreductase [Cyanobacteria bacterium SZAS-4]|nr:TIGR01777 family oxidoreductase [Cyanobacteria bacterium SZAS-4]